MSKDKLLICTDLDRTLIPNGHHPESPNARELFNELVADSQVSLAYVTGRDQVLIQKAISEYDLPIPDFVIADVGSSIYEITKEKEWSKIQDWNNKIAGDWQYKNQADLAPLFEDLKDCRLQEKEKQGIHKLSYYVSLDADIESLIETIKLRLENQEIKANIIWSINELTSLGFLDILPLNANKKLAIDFLMENHKFTLDHTVFSGDSGNDLDVIISPIKSILVANANPELKEKVKIETDQKGFTDSLYIAKGGYLNLNGNYSAGIIEGVFHYFPEIQ
jgi:sucrose-6-phosphatase